MIVRTNGSRISVPALAGLLLALAACNGSTPQQSSNFPVGSTQTDPQTGLKFVVENNRSGSASNLHVLGVQWGRLVDVYAPNAQTGDPELVFDDYLIGSAIASDGQDFQLDRNPGTGAEELTILHPFGTPQFSAAHAQIESGLQLFIDKGLEANELPPFTAVPRNAALSIAFDDLLDEAAVRNTTVKITVGYPPSVEFPCRLIPDRNHGDLVAGVFHPTRAIVDLTVSEAEALTEGGIVNAVGLPEASTTGQPNVALRIPTRTVPGSQFELLTNLSGRTLSFTGNGSTDPFATSLDVVRAFRSGGRATVTGDPFNGFLDDSATPRIVSSQSVQITSVLPIADYYLVDVLFGTTACAMTPRTGDILRTLDGKYIQVLEDAIIPPSGGTAHDVKVRAILPAGAEVDLANAEYRTPWLRASDQLNRPECWVAVNPPPGTGASAGLSKDATFTILFSEPMDPGRVNGFDSLQLLYGFSTPSMQGQVVGQVLASSDLTRYTFVPQLPLRHATGTSETYRVNLPTGTAGPVDLAGNALALAFTDGTNALPDFTLLASQAAIESRSVMMKFSGRDEDPSASNPGNDLRGQVIYDLANGRIRPRAVGRISGICDLNTPMVQQMAGGAIQVPVQFWNVGGDTPLPLWRFGCRVQTVWRHPDMGFLLMDDSTHNLDVEGLSWTPLNSGLQIDNFPQFQIALAHCLNLPDEGIYQASQPIPPPPPEPQPLSGLSDVYADNLLNASEDPLMVVHPRSKSYTVQPLDVFVSASGTAMAPYPLNRGVSQDQYKLYTWRDNSKLSLGQPDRGIGSGRGSRLINEQVIDLGSPPVVYNKGAVPTIALPLLMDFRCYPDALATSANRLMGILAVGPASPTVIENPPYFTAWSAGNINSNGIALTIDPDQTIVAEGSFPSGGNPPGGPNYMPRNQFVFFGQGDFVTRVNRAHTRWFECAPSAPGAAFNFADPVIVPSPANLPSGTQILLHYRGATGVTGTNAPYENADNFDPYGDRMNGAPQFVVNFTGGSNTWKSTMQQVNGSQFFQARITMISNIVSGATPDVSSLGFTFYR